jgi:EmrB/QacA subfamily drug resistance transporter
MTSVAPPPCDKGIVAAAPEGPTCAKSKEPFILAATILASSMAFIDGTVVNVALPALQRSLGATLGDVQWVVEAYELMLAALLLVGGAAGDRFGRRRVFVVGVLIFTVASIACGLSQRVGFLIIARGVQGIGGALLVPGSLAIISASFDKERRGRAIGTWSGFTAITMAFGPVLGGFIIDHGSWRYAFFLNVPLALVVLALTLRHVPETRGGSRGGPLDWLGALLAAIGLLGVVYALIEGQTAGWGDSIVLAALATGLVALPVFVIVEARQPAPMLPLGLFRSRDFAGANLLTLLLYAALAGSLFFLPMNLIQVQGYSTAAAGAALLPLVLLMFALSRWAGGLVEHYGAKLPLIIGPTIAACGFALFAVPGLGGSYWLTFFPAAMVLGFGMTLTVAPLTTTVMQSVSPEAAGTASGINNAVSSVAGLLAIASLGIVMSHTFNAELRGDLAAAHLPSAIAEDVESQRARLAAIDVASSASPEVRAATQHAVAAAFVPGFRRVALIAALLALASAGIAALTIGDVSRARGRRDSPDPLTRAQSDSRRPSR